MNFFRQLIKLKQKLSIIFTSNYYKKGKDIRKIQSNLTKLSLIQTYYLDTIHKKN